ncbi:hypothetical protein [Mycoplasma elephantis]|uniref:hypothetical protein n=1 Tax=Mycoplasma elephantis TaxID=114882 RepID=UPI000485D5F6|nr:hypothetical protein [Mycoplasma elephantis]
MIVSDSNNIYNVTIYGDELNELILSLESEFSNKWNTTESNKTRWYLYEKYANDMAKKVRQEKEGIAIVQFLDTSFNYKYKNNSIELSIEYGEYKLSEKSLIIRLKNNLIKLPTINENIVDNVLENMEYEKAEYIEIQDKITEKHAILADISIFKNNEIMEELSMQNKRLVLSKIDDEFGLLNNILGMVEGEEKTFDLKPKNEMFKKIELKCKIKIHKIYEIKKHLISDDDIKNMKIKDVTNLRELKSFILLQKKLEVMEKFMTSYLKKISPEIIETSKIDVPLNFINAFYFANMFKEQNQIKLEFGCFEKYLEVSKITEENFKKRIWEKSTFDAFYEILKFEVHNKYIFKRDKKLFSNFEDIVLKSHNKVDYDIRDDISYKDKIENSFLILETFLCIISLVNNDFFKKYFQDKKFPYI